MLRLSHARETFDVFYTGTEMCKYVALEAALDRFSKEHHSAYRIAARSIRATLRKFRVRPVLLAQSATQIKENYGTFESITGSCDVRVIFPSFDELTQELATQSCGEETVWKLHATPDATSVQRLRKSAGLFFPQKRWARQRFAVMC